MRPASILSKLPKVIDYQFSRCHRDLNNRYGSCFDLRGSCIGLDYPDIIEEEGERFLKCEVRHVERLIEKLMKAEITDNMHAAI